VGDRVIEKNPGKAFQGRTWTVVDKLTDECILVENQHPTSGGSIEMRVNAGNFELAERRGVRATQGAQWWLWPQIRASRRDEPEVLEENSYYADQLKEPQHSIALLAKPRLPKKDTVCMSRQTRAPFFPFLYQYLTLRTISSLISR
jgi:hypothetical protein